MKPTYHVVIGMLTPTSKPRIYINGRLEREYPDLAYALNDLRNKMYGKSFTLELSGTFIQ